MPSPRFVVVLTLLAFVAGGTAASPLPSSRQVAKAQPKVRPAEDEDKRPRFQGLPAREGFVRLHLYRIGKFTGTAIRPMVLIDGVEIGRLSGAKCVSLYLRPGTHTLETRIPLINYPIKGAKDTVTLAADSETFLEYVVDVALTGASQHHVSASYRNGFRPMTAEAARPTIAGLILLPVSPEVLVTQAK